MGLQGSVSRSPLRRSNLTSVRNIVLDKGSSLESGASWNPLQIEWKLVSREIGTWLWRDKLKKKKNSL